MKYKKTDRITPILRELHWLPVQERSQHKLLSTTYQSVHGNTPLYLSNHRPDMTFAVDWALKTNDLSTSLMSLISTCLVSLSDQRLDLSLMFPGPAIVRQSDTASKPSGGQRAFRRPLSLQACRSLPLDARPAGLVRVSVRSFTVSLKIHFFNR